MMRKILLIDDNKMLSKLLAKKIQNTLNYEVDIAHTMTEAIAMLNNEYFLSFVDLCLPDAMNGEIVDVVADKIPTIVLTASNDTNKREEFMHKNILDYIFKESDTCVDQILDAISTLSYYAKTKVILAMAKLPERNEIKKFLSQRLFKVLAAAHGEEALLYLEDNDDTKLIIADAKMPVVSGEELLAEIRTKYNDDDLGVILLGEKDDVAEARVLKNGANDYLIKPLLKELFNCRLDRVLNYMQDKKFIKTYNNLDHTSGLKDHYTFRSEVEDYLNDIAGGEQEFAFAFLDIDELKSINDEYGFEIGDSIIKICADEMIAETKGRDILGRYSAEKFGILLKNISQERALKILSRIRVNIKNAGILINLDELFFTASLGVVFANSGAKLDDLVEKATKALSAAKNNGKDRIEVCS
ncbi:bile resistance response regulator CbrR [Campylobacter upsaliensis]|uniref:bile resistance response regulator CbrR n=1 Tax=Campylobacter upsaliensis TaxID=28080 RepID=UPI0018F08417|nr:diguanylate cyclase [Campylobacter upsaliensis]EHR5126683.1 diguanylate cyclase [Campylobacter upsaliensis]EHR9973977.1 diguanylate cyclase [Campylobacter upsaliensis]EID3271706.1 diguanylate cyclase [Campylobacter upsaliensis]EIO6068121.1 diguanylate cyclase [Campylobacter upsaliensis]EIZ5520147.1 diguanylate cyclase [Campylobacter upsaliensis]